MQPSLPDFKTYYRAAITKAMYEWQSGSLGAYHHAWQPELSSSPRTHRVQGENQLCKPFLWPPHEGYVMCIWEHAQARGNRINFKLKVEKASVNEDEKKLEPSCPTDSNAKDHCSCRKHYARGCLRLINSTLKMVIMAHFYIVYILSELEQQE